MNLLKTFTIGMAFAMCGVAALAEDFTTPVTSEFNVDDLTWTGGLGKAYDMRWDAILVDGKVAVCGAGAFLDPTTRRATVELLRNASVILDGKVVMKNLTYFATYKKGQDIDKATANCRLTGAAPNSNDSQVELDISGSARF